MDAEIPPAGIDISRPHVARMYDYYLDGKDNFAVDRAAVAAVEAAVPEVRQLARENRAFLRRAVRFMIGAGIRQFVDIGAGLPTAGNTHEVAQTGAARTKVVYVDNDPIVLVHARALLATSDTTVVTADLRRPEELLRHPDLRRLVDLDEPVGMLLIAMTHFLSDTERGPILATLRDAIAPGSYIGMTHVTVDNHPAEAVAGVENVYRATPTPIYFRRKAEIADLFEGYDLVDPGLVTVDAWRPDPADPAPPATRWLYGGVARRR